MGSKVSKTMFLVLNALNGQGWMTGYGIHQAVQRDRRHRGVFSFFGSSPGATYSAIKRLRSQGLVDCERRQTGSADVRWCYRISRDGRRALSELWTELDAKRSVPLRVGMPQST